MNLRKELFYQYRSMRLLTGFVLKRFLHANLQVTYRCNFKCRICDFWKTEHNKAEELSLNDIRMIGKKLNKLGTLLISLAGGEPLIREDLCEIISILNKANHFPILITNGWFVNEDYSKDLLKAGLQEISVSVDYATASKHDAMRGKKGSWDRAINALEMLNKARTDRRNRVHMISVLMDDNIDEVEDMIKLAKELDVTYMVNLYSSSRGAKESRMPDKEVSKYLLSLKKQYPEFISLSSYLEKFDQAVMNGGIGDCKTGKLLMNIDNYGNVARCTEMLDQSVGNILKDDMATIKHKLLKVQDESECNKCWTSCRGFAESICKPPIMRQLKEFHTSVKKK